MLLTAILSFYYAQILQGNVSPEIIKDYAVVESLISGNDPKIILSILESESNFDPKRVHKNDGKIGCDSVGLVQIRNCSHPEISYVQATNPIFAVNFLISNIDKCKTWWKNTCPIK